MAKKAATEGSTEQTAGTSSGGGAASASGKKVNKTEMFDLAMQALGRNAKPRQVREWLLTKHQLDMPLTQLSTYKSNWKKKNRRKPGPKPGARAAAANAPVSAKRGDATVEEIRHLKELIGRMGESRFRDLIDLLCM